jgi:hypothetical protein
MSQPRNAVIGITASFLVSRAKIAEVVFYSEKSKDVKQKAYWVFQNV